ncbi:hypothetical protein NIES4102_24630 [Chondrocystis sp. NIES-4102]|nr:hypothetical protein NIES4102_24630 [Chondrocystis sp. NIES-4102]
MFIKNLITNNEKETLKISIVGGSNSVMRQGYAKYLNTYLSKKIPQPTSLKYYSLGGVPNIFALIQQDRHELAAESDIIFFEYCVNDRHAIEEGQYTLDLVGKSLEGFIRKVKRSNPSCLIVILIFGINLASFYENECDVSNIYQSIGQKYNLPVIDLTKILTDEQGLDYVKSLYNEQDHAHYTRPQGVQIISQTIVRELERLGIIANLISGSKECQVLSKSPIYSDNYEQLTFFSDFDHGNYFTQTPKISTYQNTVFKERNFTMYPGNSLSLLLKGRLMAIFIKSDLNDGFINIEFDNQRLVTSSYSEWVNIIKPQNVINLITLPLRKFQASSDFSPLTISLCPEYPQDFELDFVKIKPTKSDPQKWKFSIIGIAYIGEIKPLE